MVIDAARKAVADVFDPQMRPLVWKSLGLAILALIVLWWVVRLGFDWLALPWLSGFMPQMPEWTGWISAFAAIAAGLALAVALAFLIGPVSAAIAGIFLDDVAARVEARSYPDDAPGRPVPLGQGIVLSLKFFGIVILGNIVALMLLLIPGVNLIAFFVVNAFLLGREYFEFAAMRFRPETAAKLMRRENATTVFLAGLLIATLMAVPLANLLTPFFAAALATHLHKAIEKRELEKSLRRARGEKTGAPPA
ncbi:MAG TPA: sulfate transporter family protein [Rhizobiaceae bacterium]|nr:sulfate transporter family protein [Rhizobiaceae bacterium]